MREATSIWDDEEVYIGIDDIARVINDSFTESMLEEFIARTHRELGEISMKKFLRDCILLSNK